MNRVVAISREFGSLFGGRDYNGYSLQDDLWVIQKQLIEEIAEKEFCVIVGRYHRNKHDEHSRLRK